MWRSKGSAGHDDMGRVEENGFAVSRDDTRPTSGTGIVFRDGLQGRVCPDYEVL